MTVVVAQKRAESRSRYYTREEAQRLGWDVQHPSRGGAFLEEQEAVDYFPPLRAALRGGRPDFCILDKQSLLVAIVECKSDYKDLDVALREATEYAEAINQVSGFDVRIAVGVAGSPDTMVAMRAMVLTRKGKWVRLTSHGYELTQLPTPDELRVAIGRLDGTTDVELPGEKEFFDAAIAISRVLRLAKIEESARPRVIGAIIVALHYDEFSTRPEKVLEVINLHVDQAVDQFDGIPHERRRFLAQTLHLSTESDSLRGAVADIVSQLERLNVRSILRSGVDFLGKFYETFLRYGGSASAMGVVFTPRHITKLCAELVDARLGMKVYDPACGTGGFLVAAFDRMWQQATTPAAKKQVKSSLFGCDTNATVWALSVLNMYFRGDGKSNIAFGSCFEHQSKYAGMFDRVLLNPPFAQEGEPETRFIQHSLATLKPGGEAAIVIPASVLVDRKLMKWRQELVAHHHVLGVISLPSDLFYPVTAPTAILIVRAHAPQNDAGTFLANVENDGYEISKNRRIERPGSQIPVVLDLYRQFVQRGQIETIPGLACVVERSRIESGGEIIAQRWLPSAPFTVTEFMCYRRELLRSMTLAVAKSPEISEELLINFEEELASGPVGNRPTGRTRLGEWFEIEGGRTTDAKDHPKGAIPYISSGDSFNSIEDFLSPPEGEVFTEPCATVTGFGQAYIQPWRFCARGGAGSAPHVLKPRFAMTLSELIWFVGQVNAQRWRFYYGRMAAKTRLSLLDVDAPPIDLPVTFGIIDSLRGFQTTIDSLYAPGLDDNLRTQFEQMARLWKIGRGPQSTASAMAKHPAYQRIIAMGERIVPCILHELAAQPDHWFIALHEITGADPVMKNARGNLTKVTVAWLRWGAEQGYVSDDITNMVPETGQG